ncbi:MAG: NAD(P)H-hydrate dehydratase [Peptostreptococcaceae bacterium]|nr:NAD(P)H-hydrate dehydratase [Peptostreptococcaceae bacterium]
MFKLAERNPDSHKGDYGKVLIIAGSKGMAGAAALCAKGALRSGSGLVQMCVPPDILSVVQIAVLEATCIPREGAISGIEKYDAIAFGPGLGNNEEDFSLLKEILEKYSKTIVIDADGLNMLSKDNRLQLLKNSKAKIIITPHMGEAMRLLHHKDKTAVNLSREEVARELNKLSNAIVVLKGNHTVVFDGKEIWTNKNGNPGMSTGGTGDVLTGIIVSLCGQKYETQIAAKIGVYIHGLAGDLAKEDLGEHGLIAGDICYYTAKALQIMVKEQVIT